MCNFCLPLEVVVLGKRRFIFMQMKSILHVEWLLGCQKGGLEVIIYKLKKYFSITSNIILAVQQNYDRLV
jgi:hypothetical protein